MTQTLKTSERLGVVDALRGFALLAIVLLHNLEHYNLFLVPENVPAWLQIIDKLMVGINGATLFGLKDFLTLEECNSSLLNLRE